LPDFYVLKHISENFPSKIWRDISFRYTFADAKQPTMLVIAVERRIRSKTSGFFLCSSQPIERLPFRINKALPRDDTCWLFGDNGTGGRFFISPIAKQPTSVMNNTIQIQSRGESYEALATALGHIVLKFLTLQVNILLAAVALVCLFSWLITEQHTTVAIFAIVAWVFHLAVMLTIDIAKGGAEL
jgi:hypothetical protein